MKPEELVEKLKAALPDRLKSVVLYGSAAAGDHAGKRSDYNILVVLDRLGLAELKALAKPSVAWTKAGNPAPLLFTMDRLKKSADVFPIEMLDIRQTHKILLGEDLISGMDLTQSNLRLELEHELKGKLIQLREGYLTTGGKPKAVVELMVQSLSTFLVLFRAALRLHTDEVPAQKMDVLTELGKYMEFDSSVFDGIREIKTGAVKAGSVDADKMFERYLQTIEMVVDKVDDYIAKEESK